MPETGTNRKVCVTGGQFITHKSWVIIIILSPLPDHELLMTLTMSYSSVLWGQSTGSKWLCNEWTAE